MSDPTTILSDALEATCNLHSKVRAALQRVGSITGQGVALLNGEQTALAKVRVQLDSLEDTLRECRLAYPMPRSKMAEYSEQLTRYQADIYNLYLELRPTVTSCKELLEEVGEFSHELDGYTARLMDSLNSDSIKNSPRQLPRSALAGNGSPVLSYSQLKMPMEEASSRGQGDEDDSRPAPPATLEFISPVAGGSPPQGRASLDYRVLDTNRTPLEVVAPNRGRLSLDYLLDANNRNYAGDVGYPNFSRPSTSSYPSEARDDYTNNPDSHNSQRSLRAELLLAAHQTQQTLRPVNSAEMADMKAAHRRLERQKRRQSLLSKLRKAVLGMAVAAALIVATALIGEDEGVSEDHEEASASGSKKNKKPSGVDGDVPISSKHPDYIVIPRPPLEVTLGQG